MTKEKIFVIAEMACSHDGDFHLAKKIVDGSVKANADAIQLQIWALEFMMSPQRKEYELLQRLEFSQSEWVQLVKYTRDNYPELQVYVCVYEHASIEFIDSLGIDGYKLNSSDLSNPLVLDKVAATGKPINLSVGASTLAEIQAAVERIRLNSNSPITLMYGHQSFPTSPENVHMSYMNKLNSLFDLPIGYQDHCDADTEAAFWLPAAAVGMGVSVLEKHITHDRSFKGIDHESALNPDEFTRFVKMVRTLEQAKGSSVPRTFTEEEVRYREFQKKSIVAAHRIDAGTVLTSNDLTFMRAESLGYSPDKINLILGKTTSVDIDAFQTISETDLK